MVDSARSEEVTDGIFDLDIFDGVDRSLLAQFIRKEMRVEYDGGNIVRHGEPPEALYVIIDGSVDIIGINAKGREIHQYPGSTYEGSAKTDSTTGVYRDLSFPAGGSGPAQYWDRSRHEASNNCGVGLVS